MDGLKKYSAEGTSFIYSYFRVFLSLQTSFLPEIKFAGHRWGFTGKQVIHPSQVEIVQSAFMPTGKFIIIIIIIKSYR